MMPWGTAVVAVALLAGFAGLLLGVAAHVCQTTRNPLLESIEALLPQTQCGQCGYPGCRPYAAAVAQGEAINQCVPGGPAVVLQLATLLNVDPPAQPLADPPPLPIKRLAWIDEAFCIGCTKCLQVCPVDAIIGSAKMLHTVLTDYCTGCDLCVAPCPTQCIEMLPLAQLQRKWPLPPSPDLDPATPPRMSQPITLLKQAALQRLPGGLQTPDHKACSAETSLRRLPLAERLIIPLQQHAGPPGQLLVQVDQQVYQGTPLTRGFDRRMLPVHAPTSGRITAIRHYYPPDQHNSRYTLPPPLCIELQPDGLERRQWLPALAHYTQQPIRDLIERITAAGIAGLGGAGFPSSAKWPSPSTPLQLLIINAVECEPYITTDDRLMREQATEIIQGCHILQHILGPQQCVLAIEENKAEALAALQQAVAHSTAPHGLQFRTLPIRYPSGDAQQLIKLLTGYEVPQGQHSSAQGIVVHNVATLFAIQQAVIAGKPLIERVVTLTGEAVPHPGNFWVPLGTPVAHLLQQVGIQDLPSVSVTVGGPLMGQLLSDLQAPVIKTTNCLLVRPRSAATVLPAEQPCIRCGDCVTVCPVGLLPQQLYWYSRGQQHEAARDHQLFACIECGACNAVCPSHIPLVHYYQQEKAELRALDQQAQQAQQAKVRFEAKQQRLAQQRHRRQQRAPVAAPENIVTTSQMAASTVMADPAPPSSSMLDRQTAVALALARAKARQATLKAQPPATTLEPTDV